MTLQTILAIISLIGISTILGAFIYSGRKLQILDDLNKSVSGEIKPDLKKIREQDLKDIRERLIVVEERMDIVWRDKAAPTSSPRQLNEFGKNVLYESGIKEMVESRLDELRRLVKEKNATNAYDAEKATTDVMADFLKYYPQEELKIKDGAFKTGADIATVLFVGSIHLRNLIFKELGFDLVDLEKSA